MVSDGLIQEEEYKRMQRNNSHLHITKELIAKLKKQIKDATKFQLDAKQMHEWIYKQSLEKIKRGNYKGLNLTDIKITLMGEIDIAEQNIREAEYLNDNDDK